MLYDLSVCVDFPVRSITRESFSEKSTFLPDGQAMGRDHSVMPARSDEAAGMATTFDDLETPRSRSPMRTGPFAKQLVSLLYERQMKCSNGQSV